MTNRWKAAVCGLFFLAAGTLPLFCAEKESMMKTGTDLNGRSYQYVENDPYEVRIYKLKNGMTLFLSRNTLEPVLNMATVVRAGSTDEPARSTGLAHYFEHMMFKGTARMGALNYPEEKKLLDRISALFEEYRKTDDPEQKKKIYAEIDSLSGKAAAYAAPGEFSKLASAIGADELNASTSYDQTVYVAKIPANELENYMLLDSERFSGPVLRLFHTELETVYEEFNRTQDNDGRKSFQTLMHNLFPNHPLGRDVIGLPEHLKKPSMEDINRFFAEYYIPGNMALCITGDLDYEKTVALAEKYYGKMKFAPLPDRTLPPEKPMTEDKHFTVSGPESEHLRMGFRIPETRKNSTLALILSRLLSDNGYGIFEQELVRGGKTLSASAGAFALRGYLIFLIDGSPLTGQSLQDVEALERGILERIKQGKFEDWRIPAVAANLRVEFAEMRTTNASVLNDELASIFVNNEPYSDLVTLPDDVTKVTKEQVAEFASELLKHGVTVYKETGERTGAVKVEKPPITPVEVHSDQLSAFAGEFLSRPAPEPVPVQTIQPETAVTKGAAKSGLKVTRINPVVSKSLFKAAVLSPKGKLHDPDLDFALGYMEYLGTDDMTAEQLREEFYKLGVQFTQECTKNDSRFTINGPAENFEKALKLLEHFIRNARPDSEKLAMYAARVLKLRENNMKNPNEVFSRAVSYVWYGPDNPKTFEVSEKRIRTAKPEELIAIVRNLFTSSNTELVYVGPASMESLLKSAENWKCTKEDPVPHRRIFPLQNGGKPRVWIVDFDKVQLLVGTVGSSDKFDIRHIPAADILNEYFFSGLDSVVFQEIRESRALAYAAGGYYTVPKELDYPELFYIMAGTQPDKLTDVLDASRGLLKEMPFNEKKFESARDSVRKHWGMERLMNFEIYDFLREMDKMGVSGDWRAEAAAKTSAMTGDELRKFFRKQIAGRKTDIVIIGRVEDSMLKKLAPYGEIIRLKAGDLFRTTEVQKHE